MLDDLLEIQQILYVCSYVALLFMACIGMVTAFFSREILNTLTAGNQAAGGVSTVCILLVLLSLIRVVSMLIDCFRKIGKMPVNIMNEGSKKVERVDTLEFRHVTFRYPGADYDALHDISFRVKNKERVGLVGVNGAGKTTIIKLILRFYDVNQGEILVNGQDVRDYELSSLRRAFSCFFYPVFNYAFTLRENITISDISKKVSDDIGYGGIAQWRRG